MASAPSISRKRVLRYQAHPGARLRASLGVAYKDLARYRLRLILNERDVEEPVRCACEPDEWCAACMWFSFTAQTEERERLVARYARLLRAADRDGLGLTPARFGAGWPVWARWNRDDGYASWRCGCSNSLPADHRACSVCDARRPEPPPPHPEEMEIPF